MLELGIDLNAWPWVWLTVAVIFALIEITMLAGSFVLLPFAVSAFAASIAGFYGAPAEAQWAIFLFGGGALFAGGYRWARGYMSRNPKPLGVGADRLVGLVATVTAPIAANDADRLGRVVVVGEDWGAINETDQPIAVGTRVRVTAMRGTRVVVEPVPDPHHQADPHQQAEETDQ